MIADDLFAGAGGWDLAAASLGIHARGVENMPAARATRDAAGLTTIHDDVWTFKPRYLGRDLIADGLIASPPCQSFSQAGKGAGRKALDDVLTVLADVPRLSMAELHVAGQRFGDERTALVLTPLWYAVHHPYRWLAWEQVPTVLPVWEACAELLRAFGWDAWAGYLHAEQYGVPQTRKRAFLLASRDRQVRPPTPTHSRYYSRTPSKLDPGVAKWVSMAEALGWAPRDERWVVAAGITGEGRPRSPEHPAPTMTGKGTAYWLKDPADWRAPRHAPEEPCDCPVTFTATNPRPNAAHRTPCQPAPTLAFGHEQPRWNPRDTELVNRRDSEAWQAEHGTRENRTADKPAPTVTGECHRWKWNPRETTPDGLPRFHQQSDNPIDFDWPDNRPATVVAGRDLVQAPGATANRYNGSTKSRNDGVRVSVAEAGVLQSFPADHPWQGTKTRQYLQAGNAVPPGLALHALTAASGVEAAVGDAGAA